MLSRRIIFISVATVMASFIAGVATNSTIDLTGGSGSRPHEPGDPSVFFSMAIAAAFSAYLSCRLFLGKKTTAARGALAGLLTVAMSLYFFGVIYGFAGIFSIVFGGVITLVVGSIFLGWFIYPVAAVLGAAIWFRAD